MRLLQLVTFEMDPGVGKVGVRDACAFPVPGEPQDPVGSALLRRQYTD